MTRYKELDALRGIAVWMMVLYHLLFDLAYFYGFALPIYDGGWRIFARAAATMFLLLVGMCFVISWERASRLAARHGEVRVQNGVKERASNHDAPLAPRHDTFWHLYKKYFRRGLLIFAGGMVITFVTRIFAGDMYVRFGVLHLIGVSTLLLPFFTPLKKWNALLGLLIIPLTPSHFHTFTPSLDHFPLLPWLGVILIGMAIGSALYAPLRQPFLQKLDHLPYPKVLLWSGRRSLWIYFVHQPVLLGFLSLVMGMPIST